MESDTTLYNTFAPRVNILAGLGRYMKHHILQAVFAQLLPRVYKKLTNTEKLYRNMFGFYKS